MGQFSCLHVTENMDFALAFVLIASVSGLRQNRYSLVKRGPALLFAGKVLTLCASSAMNGRSMQGKGSILHAFILTQTRAQNVRSNATTGIA